MKRRNIAEVGRLRRYMKRLRLRYLLQLEQERLRMPGSRRQLAIDE